MFGGMKGVGPEVTVNSGSCATNDGSTNKARGAATSPFNADDEVALSTCVVFTDDPYRGGRLILMANAV